MRIPKLKNYFYAMTSDAYIDFAVTRRLDVEPTLTINVGTGEVTGRTVLHLCNSTTLADTHFRKVVHIGYIKPLYILRIPGDLVDRALLKPVADHVWEYRSSLTIEHCGVERIELAE